MVRQTAALFAGSGSRAARIHTSCAGRPTHLGLTQQRLGTTDGLRRPARLGTTDGLRGPARLGTTAGIGMVGLAAVLPSVGSPDFR